MASRYLVVHEGHTLIDREHISQITVRDFGAQSFICAVTCDGEVHRLDGPFQSRLQALNAMTVWGTSPSATENPR